MRSESLPADYQIFDIPSRMIILQQSAPFYQIGQLFVINSSHNACENKPTAQAISEGNQKQGSILFCKLWKCIIKMRISAVFGWLQNPLSHSGILVLYLKFLILILMWYVAGPNFRYRCDGRGVRACKSDGALGGGSVAWSPSLDRHWGGSIRWWCAQRNGYYVVQSLSGELGMV